MAQQKMNVPWLVGLYLERREQIYPKSRRKASAFRPGI